LQIPPPPRHAKHRSRELHRCYPSEVLCDDNDADPHACIGQKTSAQPAGDRLCARADILMDAVPVIVKGRPEVVVAFVGDGHMHDGLEASARRLNVQVRAPPPAGRARRCWGGSGRGSGGGREGQKLITIVRRTRCASWGPSRATRSSGSSRRRTACACRPATSPLASSCSRRGRVARCRPRPLPYEPDAHFPPCPRPHRPLPSRRGRLALAAAAHAGRPLAALATLPYPRLPHAVRADRPPARPAACGRVALRRARRVCAQRDRRDPRTRCCFPSRAAPGAPPSQQFDTP
jgi:hypothetical protein